MLHNYATYKAGKAIPVSAGNNALLRQGRRNGFESGGAKKY